MSKFKFKIPTRKDLKLIRMRLDHNKYDHCSNFWNLTCRECPMNNSEYYDRSGELPNRCWDIAKEIMNNYKHHYISMLRDIYEI